MNKILDAQLHLLDRQILDVDGIPTSVAADVELNGIEWDEPVDPDGAAPYISHLLSGPVVINRIFGGRPPTSRLYRIKWSALSRIGSALEINVKSETLDVDWPERWVRDHIIARIPGGRHDPE